MRLFDELQIAVDECDGVTDLVGDLGYDLYLLESGWMVSLFIMAIITLAAQNSNHGRSLLLDQGGYRWMYIDGAALSQNVDCII